MSFRKLTALLLAAVLTVVLIPFAAFADESDTTDTSEVADNSDTSDTSDISDSSDTSGNESDEVSDEASDTSDNSSEDASVYYLTVNVGTGADYELKENYDEAYLKKHKYGFAAGTVAELTVVLEEGFLIESVTLDGEELEADENGVYAIEMTADYTVTVSLKEATAYSVSFECFDTDGAIIADSAFINVNGKTYTSSVSLEDGTEYEIEFLPAPGYKIVGVKLFMDTEWVDVKKNPYYVVSIQEHHAYRIIVEAMETVDATVTVGENGYIELNGVKMEAAEKAYETVVPMGVNNTVAITPAEGYTVDKLTVNGKKVALKEGEDGVFTYTFSVDADYEGSIEIEASFKEDIEETKITLSIKGNGTVTVKDDEYEIDGKYIYVPKGESITFIVKADENHKVDSVKNGTYTLKINNKGEYTITCDSDSETFSVRFVEDSEQEDVDYDISVLASAGGTVSPSGVQTAKKGSSIIFKVTPDDGYTVDSVTANGKKITVSNGQFVISNISADTTVTVKFVKTAVPTAAITKDDIDWTNADTVSIDVTEKTKINADVFTFAAENHAGKKIVITGSDFVLTIPANSDFKPAGSIVVFDFTRNGSDALGEITEAVNAEFESAQFVNVNCSTLALPTGTKLEVNLGAEFAGLTLEQYEFLNGSLNSIGGEVKADTKGWVSVDYAKKDDLVFIKKTESKVTLTLQYTEGGTLNPATSVKVEAGEIKTVTVTPNEGFKVVKVQLDGVDMDIAENGVYNLTMDKDHTFTVIFDEAGSGVSWGVIIAIILIVVGVVAAAAVFILRWRKNQF